MEYKMTLSEFEEAAKNPAARHPAAALAILRCFAEIRMSELFNPRLRERIPEIPGEMIQYAGVIVRADESAYRFGDVVTRFSCPVITGYSLPVESTEPVNVPDGFFNIAMLPFGFLPHIKPKKKEEEPAPAPQAAPSPTVQTPHTYSLAAQLRRIRRAIGETAPKAADTGDTAQLDALRQQMDDAISGRLPAYDLHYMLLNLRVCDLFDALALLCVDRSFITYDYDQLRQFAYRMACHEPKASSGVVLDFDRRPEALTVGNLLLKAGELIIHPEEYDAFTCEDGEFLCSTVTAGCWMLYMLLIEPIRQLSNYGLFEPHPLIDLHVAPEELDDAEFEAMFFDETYDDLPEGYDDSGIFDEEPEEESDDDSTDPAGHPSSTGRD